MAGENGAPFRYSRGRAITVAMAALGTLAAAGCGSGPPTVSATTVAMPAYHRSLPTITGDAVQPLSQADWVGSYPVVSDGQVIADLQSPPGVPGPANAAVAAVKATTGSAVWAVTLPASLPDILGLVPVGQVVVVEAGHDYGQAPFAVFPVVTELLVLDQATGRQLWAAPVAGDYQQPPIAVSNLPGPSATVSNLPGPSATAAGSSMHSRSSWPNA
jgi:outer membrane protein assembly factor BamB